MTPADHRIKIAKQTVKMPDAMLGVMGGMTKAEALAVLAASRATVVKDAPFVWRITIPGRRGNILLAMPMTIDRTPDFNEVVTAIQGTDEGRGL